MVLVLHVLNLELSFVSTDFVQDCSYRWLKKIMINNKIIINAGWKVLSAETQF